MIKIDWNEFFHDYSVFGVWRPIDSMDDDGIYIHKWEWSKPVSPEPWHGCHRVRGSVEEYYE